MTAPRTNASHDQNRTTTLLGVSTTDGTTPVPVEVDPATGQLQVSSTGGGGGGGTQYTDGDVTIAHPIGTIPVYDKAGTITAVSVANPLPVNASLSTPADTAPATQNITVIDSSSSTATGANGQSVIIGTPTAGSAASFSLASIETVRVMVTGIWTGTLVAEQSLDGGTTWTGIGIHQGAYTTGSFTAGFVGGANVAGATNFRMRATAAITGTAVVKVIESVNTQSVYIANAAPAGNVVSLLNSSSATLTSGSVFTGTSEDVSNFSEMRVSVFSDVASATDGLSLQQSSNGTNWDITDTYTVSLSAAGAGKTYVVPRQAKFFRIVYTNGGTNQATFRLQTILNRTATAPSSQRPTDAYTNETDLVQNQAFLMGYNGTTWDRIRTLGTGVLSASTVLTAGSAIIGKVGIDQTTPGTTNAVSANQGTAAALSSPWPTYNGEISDFTGTFTNATQTNSVTASGLDGYGNILISIQGTYGTATAVFEGSDDSGTTWFAVDAAQTSGNTIEGGYTSLTNITRSWQINVPGFDSVRVRSTAVASGTVNVRMSASAANGADGATVGLAGSLPAGANIIGALTANQSVNVAQVNGVTTLMGNGVTGTGSQRVTIASDNTAFSVNAASVIPGTTATSLGKAEDAAHTTGDTGVAIFAVRDDTLNATSGTEGDYELLHTTAEGALWVTQAPSVTNGWATFNATSGDGSTALTATAQQVKSSAGTVGGWYIYNPNASATYVNFYNATSASVTVGTTNQQMVICVPATAGANVEFGNGITFATAISISATTTGGGNTAPATSLEANIYYK